MTKRQIGIISAFIITFILGFAKAATYLECTSKDIKTCTKEVSKGAMMKGLFLNDGKKYVKLTFQTLNEKKGTAVEDKE